MNPVNHGRQRSQAQDERICSFDYSALCCAAEADRDSNIGPLSCSGREPLWERNTATRHEPNPTPISLVKLNDRCRSWKKLSTGWNCSANPDFFRKTDWP